MPDAFHSPYEASPTSAARAPMRSRGRMAPNITSRSNRISAARRRLSEAMQPGLFLELVEVTTTRDEPFVDRDGWGTRPMPPVGDGWRIVNYSDEHATTWARTRVIPSWGRSP